MVAAVAWIAGAAALTFIYQSERQLIIGRTALRVFDEHARELSDALANLRAGQQAYVASGQGEAIWLPKVTATTDAVSRAIVDLRSAAQSLAARASLDQAGDAVDRFIAVDKRARDYMRSGDLLMAGDLIFSEGVGTIAAASSEIDHARVAEHDSHDLDESSVRMRQAAALDGSAFIATVILLTLALVRGPAPLDRPAKTDSTETIEAAPPAPVPAMTDEALASLTTLCTELARAHDVGGAGPLLERAAHLICAKGLIVWLGDDSAGELRPVLAHGYADDLLARLPRVARSSDNAAAAAYRTGTLQIVPGAASRTGAIVAPILAGARCVGVLSAETSGGDEASPRNHALAAIIAAGLAAIVHATVPTITVAPNTAVANL
jgi:hypothetical protein